MAIDGQKMYTQSVHSKRVHQTEIFTRKFLVETFHLNFLELARQTQKEFG